MHKPKLMIGVGVVVFLIGFAVGVGVGLNGGLKSTRQFMDLQARGNLDSTLKRTQTELRHLGLLRAGAVDQVIDELELLVDSHILSIGVYESAFQPENDQAYFRRVLREIEDHRAQYAVTIQEPVLLNRINAALRASID